MLGALVGTKTNSDFAGLAGLPPRTANRRAIPKGPGGADAARVIVWVEPAAALLKRTEDLQRKGGVDEVRELRRRLSFVPLAGDAGLGR